MTAKRPYRTAMLLLGLAAALAFVAWLPSASSTAHAAASLQQRISAGQGRISALEGSARLSGQQLAKLNSSIAQLQRHVNAIEALLLVDRSRLLWLRGQLDRARARLAALERFQARAESVLAAQLINGYEGDRPDIISVVLEAHGFADLLERLSFAQRIRHQDVQVTTAVRAARRAVAAQAIRLGALEVRQQRLTEQVLGQRNVLDRARISLLSQQLAVAGAHAAQVRQLGSARASVAALRNELAQLEAAAAARARAAAVRAAASVRAASPVQSTASAPAPAASSGGFVFPLPRSAAGGPGSWSPDDGVDITAPGDTPEYAVCSGTIVLHGIGGFGPWAPVIHCDSSLGGYSYVYYGHAGPADQLPVGTHVAAGEVMSSVGPGDVGISTGPHLEIGFCDGSGTPLGPGTAGTMMSLLQSSY